MGVTRYKFVELIEQCDERKCYIERQRIATQLKEQLNSLCPILIKGSN